MHPKLPIGPELTPDEQTFAWFSRPYVFLDECAKKYGDTFTLNFKGLGEHVFFSHPDAIQEIFAGDPAVFYAGQGNSIIKPFLGNDSLLILDGPNHARHRKMMGAAFHGQKMKPYLKLMIESTQYIISKIEVDTELTIHSLMLDISLEIILRALFGTRNPERFKQMKELLVPLLDFAGFSTLVSTPDTQSSNPRDPWVQYQRRSKELDRLLFEEVAEHKTILGNPATSTSHEDDQSILGVLLAQTSETGQGFTDPELRDELVTLLLAGHETTATVLTWAFYWIHSTEGVRPLLMQELNTLSGKTDSETLSKLSYLDGVVKESLRIFPVIPVVSRKLQQSVTIAGINLPAEIQVTPCIYLVHHREELYPEPKRFNPERFVTKRYAPHEFLPFGGGARRCIGMAFGMLEMKTVLSLILSQIQLELTDQSPVRPVRRTVTVSPSGGVRMKVKEKRLHNIEY